MRFGALDCAADVRIGGRKVASHEGGYDPFEAPVPTHVWGETEIVLRVADPLGDGAAQPHGKEGANWYTPVSGPWQSIVLLRRPRRRIYRLFCRPDLAAGV